MRNTPGGCCTLARLAGVILLVMTGCQQEADTAGNAINPGGAFRNGDLADSVMSTYGPPESIIPGDNGLQYWNYSSTSTSTYSKSAFLFFEDDGETNFSRKWTIPIKDGKVFYSTPHASITPSIPSGSRTPADEDPAKWLDSRLHDPIDPRRTYVIPHRSEFRMHECPTPWDSCSPPYWQPFYIKDGTDSQQDKAAPSHN